MPLLNGGSVGMAQMAARGIGGRLEEMAVFFCLGWSLSYLGVTAKLAVPELDAAEKTVVRPSSWVRPETDQRWEDAGGI